MDKTKIIVVEDNIVYCEFVCNMLSREGGLPYREGLPPVNSEETSATGDG